MQKIPVFQPLIEQEEIAASTKSLELGWLGMGSYVGEFEDAVKKFLNISDRYVAAVSTGHAALHLGLMIAGVGVGDEVITPSFNNIADFQAILATGAEPVFCDIDKQTLCIDLDKAEQLITTKTKAIIIMDYDCVLCDHSRVAELAHKYNIRIIHDAAHSFGSKYKDQMIGSFSDICMFSFDPVKTITCIDGGIIIVRTEEELNAIHEMRLIGMGQPSSVMYQNQRAWTYDVKRIGFRYHMANLHAAIGLAQIAKMSRISDNRAAYGIYYNQALSQIPQVKVPQTDFSDITPFLYYIRVPEKDRDALRAYLLERGVDTGIHWQPGHLFTLFKDFRRGDLSVTEEIVKEIFSLPLHSCMSIETLDKIINIISSYFQEK
ncbi:DegT/DnrJ/EryC1/StrS aminotransferase family protein [Chamaesiphon sp. VAR_48_metabat_403]|uniref:DegT/DnrJ/EryC1/StrS family aminotransferase n=1 Tax=Chamaesiphon sp. VAR_48_metabat_403 TaxID=2964700 RepID=UPI00286DA51C|nr:DegT/DnrJ/EryC1/StrS aminotransferase family protein [Chamaesiphon sp. VAR_48_metabat_403]